MMGNESGRLRNNYVDSLEFRWSVRVAQGDDIFTGCSNRPSSKAAASEEGGELIWFIWFVSFIWLVLFNQTNETNQTTQTTVFLR